MDRNGDRGTVPPRARVRGPSSYGRLVRREALFEQLSRARNDCVVLVCALAGSGKTMLVRSWLEGSGLSTHGGSRVEPRERDAQHFWLAVTNALAAALGGFHEPLGPDSRLSWRGGGRTAAGGPSFAQEPLVLVIDDLHELQSPEALTWLELFITRRPAGLRMVLTSRSEPDLNVHRLRLAA